MIGSPSGARERILVIAPHPDDEVLGAGGTIAKYSALGHEVTVLTVSGHLPPVYPPEAYQTTLGEAQRAHEVLGVGRSAFLEVPATLVSREPVHTLNGRVFRFVEEVEPQVVLCPFPDRHIDHRAIFDAVMVATRPVRVGRGIRLLAAYETLSETHWNAPHIEPSFVPNLVVNITEQMQTKVDALQCYASQISPAHGPRSTEAVKALAGFRGTQAGFPFGEAFHVIRMTG